MHINLDAAKNEWRIFIDHVDQARKKLGCENDHAWFRGVENPAFSLTPALFRTVQWRQYVKNLPSLVGAINLVEENCSDFIGLYADCIDHCDPHITGEYDVYSEFAQRSEVTYPNSWEQLAAMQHFGCGTRLSDWTDDFHVALGFALVRYYESFSKCRVVAHATKMPRRAVQWTPSWLATDGDEYTSTISPSMLPSRLGPVALWIMNPYKVAAWAWGTKSIP